MGWFTDALEHLDRPSNALQGLVTEGTWDDAVAGWNLEKNYDFEDLYSDEFREQYPETSYWTSGALNLIADPLNLVGAGLFKKGVQGVDAARKIGANIDPKMTDMFKRDGNILSNFPNYIPDHYGPSNMTKGWMKKSTDLLSSKTTANPEMLNPAIALAGNGVGKVRWLGHGFNNMLKQGLNTERRALQAETGINQSMLGMKALADKNSFNPELVARAMYNADILSQQGKAIPKELQEVLNRTFHTSNTPISQNTYATLIGDLTKGVDNLGWSTKDLERLSNHLYRGPHTSSRLKGKGKKLSPVDDEGLVLLNIKRQQGLGGNHYADLTKRATVLGDVAKVMGKLGNQSGKGRGNFSSVDEMYEALKKQGVVMGKNAKDTDGIWLQRTYKGSSIREGAYNLAIKVKPDGDFIAMMSDEHNFLETLGGDVMVKNRMISATPPMTGNLKTTYPSYVLGKTANKRTTTINKEGGEDALQLKQWESEIEEVSKFGNQTRYLDTTSGDMKRLSRINDTSAAPYAQDLLNMRANPANVDLLNARRKMQFGAGMLGANAYASPPN